MSQNSNRKSSVRIKFSGDLGLLKKVFKELTMSFRVVDASQVFPNGGEDPGYHQFVVLEEA